MADLDNGQRSPKFGQGLLLGGERLSKLAENPIFQRVSKNKWFQKRPPWVWGGLVLVGLFAVIWFLNSRMAPPPPTTSASGGGNTTELAVDILVKLSLIVGLIYGALWVFRRWRGADLRSGAKKIDVLETVHLSPRRAIHLVRAGDREVLIGATDQNITFLSEIKASSSIAVEQPVPAFARVLADETGTENLNGGDKIENSSAIIEKRSAKSENDSAKYDLGVAINSPGGMREVDPIETAESHTG
jgi:flagellar biosynthetic protein FliO